MRKTSEVNPARSRGEKARKDRFLFPFVLFVSLALHALVFFALGIVIAAPRTGTTPARVSLERVVHAKAVSAAQVERWVEQKEEKKRILQEQKLAEQREKERLQREKLEAREAERARKREAKKKAQALVQKREAAARKKAEEAKAAAEARKKAEEAKAAAKARKKAEEAKAAAEVRKKAEEAKAAAEARKKAEEAKAAAEARKKAEEAKAAAEARKKAEEAKAAAEARKKVEEAKAAAAARRKVEEAKAAAAAKAKAEEDARLRAEAAERRSRELVLLVNKYIRDIQNKVRSVWTVPPGGIGEGNCTIRFQQDRSGFVRSVKIQSCDGNQLYRQSLEDAVLKAAPLPLPGDEEIFDEEVEITFWPQ